MRRLTLRSQIEKRMKKLLSAIAFLAIVNMAQAQDRYGHLNFGNLIAEMDATAEANTALEEFQQGLVATGELMADSFQQMYLAFSQDVQNGNLTPVQQQEAQAFLQAKQQQILAYEQEIIQDVSEKREELLAPIIEQAEAAVAKVSEANGFTMVFDTSIFGAVLFAHETEDLMPLVKAELGIE